MKLRKLLTAILAWTLGLTFVFSGFLKAVDPYGGALKINEYLTEFGLTFLVGFEMPLSIALCAAELIVGLFLLFGILRKPTAFVSFCFFVVFTPITGFLAFSTNQIVQDCGCFGDALSLTNTETFAKNLVLFLVSFAYLLIQFMQKRTPPNQTTFLHRILSLTIATLLVLFSVSIPVYSAYCLPAFDFLDYNRGAELHWNEENTGHSLRIYDRDLNDVSSSFTTENKHYFFITLQEGSNLDSDMIYRLTNPAILHEKDIVELAILTSSAPEDRPSQGLDVYFTDPITLKSLIRDQSGVVLIKNDVIAGKWNLRHDHFAELTQNNIDTLIDEQADIKSRFIITLIISLTLIFGLSIMRKYV